MLLLAGHLRLCVPCGLVPSPAVCVQFDRWHCAERPNNWS